MLKIIRNGREHPLLLLEFRSQPHHFLDIPLLLLNQVSLNLLFMLHLLLHCKRYVLNLLRVLILQLFLILEPLIVLNCMLVISVCLVSFLRHHLKLSAQRLVFL